MKLYSYLKCNFGGWGAHYERWIIMYLSCLYVHISHRQSLETQTVQTRELVCSVVIKGEQILYEFYTLIG
jgi:hypothetical protein